MKVTIATITRVMKAAVSARTRQFIMPLPVKAAGWDRNRRCRSSSQVLVSGHVSVTITDTVSDRLITS
jgi:hypothetical protein